MVAIIITFLGGALVASVIWYLVLRNNPKRVQNWLSLPESIRKKYVELEV